MVLLLDRATKLLIERQRAALGLLRRHPASSTCSHREPRAVVRTAGRLAVEWRAFGWWGRAVVTAFVARCCGQSTRRRRGTDGAWRTALALVVGAPPGNLTTALAGRRHRLLQVFIGAYEWPAFNVADSAISIGAVFSCSISFATGVTGREPDAAQLFSIAISSSPLTGARNQSASLAACG